MTTIEGVLIRTNGVAEVVEFPSDDFLVNCYELLNCTRVDCFSATDSIDIWIDDDGMYDDQEINTWLMRLTVALAHKPLRQPLYGNGLLVGFNELGETISLTQEQIQSALALHRAIHSEN